MRRREVIALGGAGRPRYSAARGARAAPTMPVIGFLHLRSPEPMVNFVAAYRKGLSEGGLCRRSERRNRISLGGGPG